MLLLCAGQYNLLWIVLQESLAAQRAILDEKEAALHECERQRTHLEAENAVRHHQQQTTIAKLEDSEADMAAKVHMPSLALCLNRRHQMRV